MYSDSTCPPYLFSYKETNVKSETVKKSVATAHKGGHQGGRIGWGVTMIGVGGLGAACWGLLTGAAEITKELFPPAAEEETAVDEGAVSVGKK